MARARYGTFTPARRAALKKAQAASARKRSRLGAARAHIGRNKAKYALLAGAGAVAAFGATGGRVRVRVSENKSVVTGKPLGNGLRNIKINGVTAAYGKRRVIVSVGRGRAQAIGKPIKRKIDRDQIPLHSLKGSRSWPHLGEERSRKQIAKLRGKGLIE